VSCENVGSATLKSCRWDYITNETFLYLEKEKYFMMKQLVMVLQHAMKWL